MRIGVTDEEWALIGPLLPPEHGRRCRAAGDNRRCFEGMMWWHGRSRSGAICRMNMASGTASSAATRAGSEPECSTRMLETLAELAGRERSADMIGSTEYRWRNLVERLFNKLKNWRRIAT